MKLGDLFRGLYKKKSKEIDARERLEDLYDPKEARQVEDEFGEIESVIIEKQEEGKETKTEIKKDNRKVVLAGGIGVVFLVATLVSFWGYMRFVGSAFEEEKVKISIEGIDRVESTQIEKYRVVVENRNRVDLENVVVKLNYSDGLVLKTEKGLTTEGPSRARIEVGKIGAKKNKEIELEFEFFGPKNRQTFIEALMLYQPENFNSTFESKTSKSIVIVSTPFVLEIVAIQKVSSGERLELNVITKNKNSKSHNNIEVRMEYPEGFSYEESEPEELTSESVWKIGNFDPGVEKNNKIRGSLYGKPEEIKKFKAVLGKTDNEGRFMALDETEELVQIVAGRVELYQEVNQENIYPGQKINYEIKFKNISEVPLRDLILIQHIDSRAIDFEKMLIRNGYYDVKEKGIIWKAIDVPKLKILEPGEEGSVIYRTELLEEIPVENEEDKNFTIVTQSEIHSLDVDSPLGYNKKIKSSQKELRINSDVEMDVSVHYDHENISNSGPVPLKIGETTTLAIDIEILNSTNDLRNVVLKTGIPAGVKWTGEYFPEDEAGVEFNERTNELEWVIGRINAGIGLRNEKKKLSFQIKVVPSENQANNRKIELVKETVLYAKDSFTNNDVEYREGRINSERIEGR